MMNRVKSKFLVTTAVLLAGVGFASAQGVSGGGGGGRRRSERKGNVGGRPFRRRNGQRRFQSGRRFPQRRNNTGPWVRICDSGRAEGSSARGSESSRAQREESGTQERGRAEGPRDSSKGQTAGQGREFRPRQCAPLAGLQQGTDSAARQQQGSRAAARPEGQGPGGRSEQVRARQYAAVGRPHAGQGQGRRKG